MTESQSKVSRFESDPVTPKEVVGYNMGSVPGAFFAGFMGQINAFYYRWMGLGWELIILGQILFALWNVINDPLFGLLMNKTKTKSGRYIPWIKWCAPLFTVGFILVFFPPQTWRGQLPGGEAFQIPLFIFYVATQCVYDTFFTIVYIAHVALLPQMTMATTERTKIAVIYGILSIVGGLGAGLLPVIFLTDPSEASIQAFQVFVVVFGIAALLPWYFVVAWVKERQEFIPEQDVPLREAFKYVFRNPSGRIYIIYDGISVGILNILLSSLTFMFAYLLGLNNEDRAPGFEAWGIMEALPVIIALVIGGAIGAVVQFQIPKKRDIKTAIMVGLICQAIGFFIAFLGALPAPGAPDDLYQPSGNVPLLAIGMGIGIFGLMTDLIYHNPMRADTIDWDEAETGERHESIYAGIGCIFSKPMISVALAIVPAIMGIYGLIPAAFEEDMGATLTPSMGWPSAITGVAVAALLVPSILATIGAITWHWYPLDRKALEELHGKLDGVHDMKRAERLGEDGRSKFV